MAAAISGNVMLSLKWREAAGREGRGTNIMDGLGTYVCSLTKRPYIIYANINTIQYSTLFLHIKHNLYRIVME